MTSEYEKNTSELNRIQLRAFVVAAVIAVAFCLYFGLLGFCADNTLVTVKLEQRINPNDAPPESLARLPGIGAVRAQAIVSYRQQFLQSNEGDLAFEDCNDLQKVKGIGPKTAQGMCRWLRFE